MLCKSQALTVLGNTTCMLRNSADATLPALHMSFIFDKTRFMVSVVHLLGLPPNWVGGSRLKFSVI